jgi:two-component sensor histidine kinase
MNSRRAERRHGHGLDALVDSLREGFVLCRMIRDAQGQVIDYVIADGNIAYLRGLGGKSAIGKRLKELRPDISPNWYRTCGEIIASGKPRRMEYWDPASQRWYDCNMTPLPGDELIMLYVDVTRRKTEVAREQERFKELNHRVKNNLNLVAAMLALQAKGANPDTRLALDQAAARVHTISEVHNLLHRAGSLDSISFDQYLRDLCEKLERSLAPAGVKITVEADCVPVTIEQAVELGVVVNELLTNALKYAYPQGTSGDVLVTSRPNGDTLVINIRDFGAGLPANHNGGLGMKLVRSLVQQNGGVVSIHPGVGAHIEVRVPLLTGPPDQTWLL